MMNRGQPWESLVPWAALSLGIALGCSLDLVQFFVDERNQSLGGNDSVSRHDDLSILYQFG